MSGVICSAPCKKITPAFICGSSRACRVRTRGSGNMTVIFGAAVLARVVFVETPTMCGLESTTMPVFANVGLQLADAMFGLSWRNRGGGVSGGSSGI